MTHEEHMDAALCVWEELLRWLRTPDVERPPSFIQYSEHVGTYELRMHCSALGEWVHRCWVEGGSLDWDVPFDWEVVPALLAQIQWHPTNGPEIPDDIKAAVTAAKATLDGGSTRD